MSALDRARRDEAQGDLGSARARLRSCIATAGYSPEICEQIARLSMKMHDPVEAGRWYFLCDSADPGALAAIERFGDSCGGVPRHIYFQLPASLREIKLDRLPPAARERLENVRPPRPPRGAGKSSAVSDTLFAVGCTAAILAFGISTLTGAIMIVIWFLRLIL